jgi:hypothetical protein
VTWLGGSVGLFTFVELQCCFVWSSVPVWDVDIHGCSQHSRSKRMSRFNWGIYCVGSFF